MKFLSALILVTLAQASYANAPEWFSDYVKKFPGCDTELLCSVGEGETLADALSEARGEVAKFFQAKIQSKSQVSVSSEQKGTNVADASVDEWTNKTSSVETSELISGLEIRKQEQADGRYYVLMTLERQKTAGLLKEKILELDTENSQLLELNSRFAYPKILKNLAMIEPYNDRYTLLARTAISLKVKKETIQQKINKLTPMKMALVTKGKKLPAKLSHELIAMLSPLKVVIVAKKHAPPYTLRGEIVAEEQYFKVDGFKKLNVVYKLELLNSQNVVIGKMSTMSEQVARNIDHALEKALPEITEALKNNLDQLSSK
ncbi:MAG: LPP20 family lipoprotein [Bacteriovorax sp.]|jgi:hypothetical protein